MQRLALAGVVLSACSFDSTEASGESDDTGLVTLTAATSSGSGPAASQTSGSETSTTAGASDPSGAPPSFDLGSPTSGTPPGGECKTTLPVTLRDFQISHPDMQHVITVDPGIVEPDLGADGLPVYAGGTNGSTNGKAAFDQWYRDVAGVNESIPYELELDLQPDGTLSFDNAAFFPIDDQGFGNEGNVHNYHFTLELHTQFTYEGGEVFTFRGDDDVFMFINGRLGIDLGGVHGPLEASIDMDAVADDLGIAVGQTYPLDFFFAERHTSQSNFRIETSIGCFQPPVG